jgi:hypothetical protein
MGGTQWFSKAQQIAQNSQNRNYEGWNTINEPRSRILINEIMNELEPVAIYHLYLSQIRMDNLFNQDQTG